jgi:hypothetical protein
LGGGNFVVFRGGGAGANSVTVTGLTPGLVYYFTVYEYAGSGTAKAFNEAGATNSFAVTPPLTFTGTISVTPPTTAVPINGVGGAFHVFAPFIQAGLPGILEVTSSCVSTATNGIVVPSGALFTGQTLGTDPDVTVSFTPPGGSPIVSAPFSVSTRNPTYSDNFNQGIDYYARAVANPNNPAAALAGTIWDGMFLGGAQNSAIPAGYSIPGGIGIGATTALDAGITLPNTLSLTHNGDEWGGTGAAGANDGFLLYKNVVGDFQASVFLTNMTIGSADHMAGVMARLASSTGASSSATGIGGENFVSLNEFELFNLVDVVRFETAGGDNNFGSGPQPPLITGSTNGFLMVRSQGTNFTFYRRNGPTNAWTFVAGYTATVPAYTNSGPYVVEVGPDAATYGTDGQAAVCTAGFQSFMLDLATGPLLKVTAAGGNITISWNASDSFNHIYSSTTLPGGFTIDGSVTITTLNGISSATIPIGTGDKYYEVGP